MVCVSAHVNNPSTAPRTKPAHGAAGSTVEAADDEFTAFYVAEYRRLTAVAGALTGSWAIAEELTQDALLTAHRRWNDVRGLDDPAGWVRRVLVNRCVSRWRRTRAEIRAITRIGPVGRTVDVELSASTSHVWDAVRALPRRQRQVIVLSVLEGHAAGEIATILDCAEATVRVHLSRARRTLAKTLDGTLDDVPVGTETEER